MRWLVALLLAFGAAACTSHAPTHTCSNGIEHPAAEGPCPTVSPSAEPSSALEPSSLPGTGRTVEPRPQCMKSSFTLQPGWDGATGQSIIYASLEPTPGTSDCRIVERVRFTLVDARTGRPLTVPHNGVTATRTVRLFDPDRGAPTVSWGEPYCSRAAVDVVATDDLGHRAVGHDVLHPRCDPAFESGTGPGLAPL